MLLSRSVTFHHCGGVWGTHNRVPPPLSLQHTPSTPLQAPPSQVMCGTHNRVPPVTRTTHPFCTTAGTSFTGDVWDSTKGYIRGKRVQTAVIQDLLDNYGMKGAVRPLPSPPLATNPYKVFPASHPLISHHTHNKYMQWYLSSHPLLLPTHTAGTCNTCNGSLVSYFPLHLYAPPTHTHAHTRAHAHANAHTLQVRPMSS
jgi:hypothetical protein